MSVVDDKADGPAKRVKVRASSSMPRLNFHVPPHHHRQCVGVANWKPTTMGRRGGPQFCCFIFPLVKFGAYLLVIESAFMALCVGILALAPPPIVGAMASISSWSKALVAAFAFATAAWQIVGIASVVSDKRSLYRLYIRVNFLATLAILAITIAFTVTAAARHSTAVAACYNKYEGSLAQDGLGVQAIETSLVNGRHKVCDILCWVDVGLMGGLIVLLGLTQLFMCYMQRKYGQRQRTAYSYGDKPYGADGIPLASKSPGNWHSRGQPHYSPVPDPPMNRYPTAADNREYYQARQY